MVKHFYNVFVIDCPHFVEVLQVVKQFGHPLVALVWSLPAQLSQWRMYQHVPNST
jgi:hypothetical protein